MGDIANLQEIIQRRFSVYEPECLLQGGELTMELPKAHWLKVAEKLRDDEDLGFDMLLDVCGVDYQDHGYSEWSTEQATATGFERAANNIEKHAVNPWVKPRFAAVYHLLSLAHNHRLRVRVFVDEEQPMVDSVNDLWPAANWFEREAFDLYGILFVGHPDLRRLLTDYGFIGHPFRKDFPLSGQVEVRYDATQERVVYEPVNIEPRILVPKVIRVDNRYTQGEVPPSSEGEA